MLFVIYKTYINIYTNMYVLVLYSSYIWLCLSEILNILSCGNSLGVCCVKELLLLIWDVVHGVFRQLVCRERVL